MKTLGESLSSSALKKIALYLLAVALLAGAFPQLHAQHIGVAIYSWPNGHLIRSLDGSVSGNCPDTLASGMECWSTGTYQDPGDDPEFVVVLSFHAKNNGLGAVMEVTGTVIDRHGVAAGVGIVPDLHFDLSDAPASAISGVAWMTGSCNGVGQGSYMDDALAINAVYATGQVDGFCSVFLSPLPHFSPFISGVSFFTPAAGPYQSAHSMPDLSPQPLEAFAPGSRPGSSESFELDAKFGPATYLVP